MEDQGPNARHVRPPLDRGDDLSVEHLHRNLKEAPQDRLLPPDLAFAQLAVGTFDVIVIPRTSRSERLKENFAIFDFEVSERDMAEISAMSRGA